MFLFINIIIVRTTRKLRPFIDQFAPNLFALGRFSWRINSIVAPANT